MTTAIALWVLMVGTVVAYAAWAAVAVAEGSSAWWFVAGLPLAYLAILASVTSSWFALAWIFRAQRPARTRLGPHGCLRLFWDELCAIAGSGPRMALYRLLIRDPDPAPAPAPVLLLHGVLCNAGVWHRMRAYLRARGIGPLYTLSYGPPLASIERFADDLAVRVDAILLATGARCVTLVGHSMGGLVARAYLRRHGGAKVGALLTLGAPHHGSVHAALFPGTCLRQMRPGSAWLAELNREAPPYPPRVTSVWSWHDSMVAPQTSSRLAGAENVELAGIGHNALLTDRRVFALVGDLLERLARDATNESPA
jgi:triacylglycerol esterase/lipase EstA (alpha/beta hydrolase family)